MTYRTIRFESEVTDQISALKIGYRRWDEILQAVEDVLCLHPEMFPVIAGTRISLCRTNEFVGHSFLGVPSLAIYFIYDRDNVYLLSIESAELEG